MKSTRQSSHLHRRAVSALLGCLILLACLYVYFVSKSVLNVVMREEIEQDIAALSSTIGDLEFQYLSLQNSVDLSRAQEFGLVALDEKQFVARHSLVERGLTLNR